MQIELSHLIFIGRRDAPIEEGFKEQAGFAQALMHQKMTAKGLIVYSFPSDQLNGEIILTAFAKSIKQEYSPYQLKVVGCDLKDIISVSQLINELESEEQSVHVRYQNLERQVERFEGIETKRQQQSILKIGGVYLITGGLGGIGYMIARYLAVQYKAKLILTGRSELVLIKQNFIEELEKFGAEVQYLQGDVSDQSAVARWIERANSRFGSIQGIIHSAGILDDGLLMQKDWQRMKSVLAPKIKGALNLDQAAIDEPLDFFLLFSSIASCLGNLGQTDYASANAFLDKFVEWRQGEVVAGRRKGKSVSINWPFWADGGMQVSEAVLERYESRLGMRPLPSERGIEAFEEALLNTKPQVVVFYGKRSKANALLNCVNSVSQTILPRKNSKFIEDLSSIAAKLIKSPIEKINIDHPLSEYGFDSILFTDFSEYLNKQYGLNTTPALFFTYTKLAELGEYLWNNCQKELTPFYQSTHPSPAKAKKPMISSAPKMLNEPIAIIGMAGRFPQSNDLDSFWTNLEQEKDLISEVPLDRWNWREYYSEYAELNKTNSKWGGFIADFDKFDAPFFNISRREAELMDPQHRLFLQTVWNAIEMAGYDPYSFASQVVGLFAGVQFNEYQTLLSQARLMDVFNATGNSHAMLANRISYLLDWHGPSEAIDTACSSSLVAVNRAVQALQTGECKLAVAGGVSLMLSPETFIMTSQLGILSPQGRCKTFDQAADGYVKGEGVGAIFLKPLSEALAAGDHIYGIIRGTAVNHGGKSQSLTAPNAKAQSQLLLEAYKKAGISIDTIGYIETHGTGTKLGDPVEIEGLKLAFSQDGCCALGSIKTNIGHLEPAAGIAGIIKVLLAMQHGKLPGNVHFKQLNSHIQLENSPFYIISKTEEWKRLKNNQGQDIARRAGISSFGFGGTNAHVVIEEGPPQPISFKQSKECYICTISAKHSESLKERISELAAYLKKLKSLPLEAISFTLNTGRSHFEHRYALVVSSFDELQDKLSQLETGIIAKDCFLGDASRQPDDKAIYDEVMSSVMEKLKKADLGQSRKHLLTLANLYVKGYDLDWSFLHQNETQQKIYLPTYPFLKKRYWFDNLPVTNPKKVEEPKQKLSLKSVASSSSLPPGGSHSAPMTKIENKRLSFDEINHGLKKILAALLFLDEEIDEEKVVSSYGIDSILGVEFIGKINDRFSLQLSVSKIYDFPTVKTLAAYIAKELPDSPAAVSTGSTKLILNTVSEVETEKKKRAFGNFS